MLKSLVIVTLVSITTQQAATLKTITLDKESNYQLTYNILNDTSANPVLNGTLSISGLVTKDWVADGKTGMFMGLGYGSNHMRNTDGMLCQFLWTNKSSDAITCLDIWFSETHSVVFGPETNDVKTIRTLQANVTAGAFSV